MRASFATLLAGTFASAALVATALPAAAVDYIEVRDPGHDVTVAMDSASAAQRATVDLRYLTYDVSADSLTISQTFRSLTRTPGNQFAETLVTGKTGDGTKIHVTLTTKLGSGKVKVFTGSSYYTCKGATARTVYRKKKVVQDVPISCLDAFSKVSLRTSAVLAKKNGSTIVKDRARRVGGVVLDG